MSRSFMAIAATAFLFTSVAPSALACFDNSDQVVQRLKKLDLSTDQLKAIFAYQTEHRAVIQQSHRDGSGCLTHERHDSVFEKQAFGVLTDSQFKNQTGRVRSDDESLRYQNYLLKIEIDRLKAEIADLKRLKEDAKKEEAKKEETKKEDTKKEK